MKRILIVDDDEAHRLWSHTILEENGYYVDTFHSAIDALAQFEREEYALIISDLVMPEMNGNEFLKKVAGIRQDQKAIIITGHADMDTYLESLYDIGALEYIVKPIKENEFLAVVGKLIADNTDGEQISA